MTNSTIVRTLTGITIVASLILAHSQCIVIVPDQTCGAAPTIGTNCSSCIDISYSPSGPENDCASVAEGGCGSTVCNYNQVDEVKTTLYGAATYTGPVCWCDYNGSAPVIEVIGCCEEDTAGGGQCGNCN
jgi:hypothetical protein